MDTYNLYNDIGKRTNGEIYLGVVGPVRSGKSTFIKNFVKEMILPNIKNKSETAEIIDETPQSAGGKTIMTTEPKFIPRNACEINLTDNLPVKMRLIDCVGFMIDGANGNEENGKERLVKTPWFDQGIPFSQAAEIGTRKVIKDHSTVGIVITTDGSIGEIDRKSYISAEETAINELKALGKPFVVLVNSKYPASKLAREVCDEIAEKYKVSVMVINAENLSSSDINNIFELLLGSFPISRMEIYCEKWLEFLPEKAEIMNTLSAYMSELLSKINCIRDAKCENYEIDSPYIDSISCDKISLSDGILRLNVFLKRELYFGCISALSGKEVKNDKEMFELIREYSLKEEEVSGFISAIKEVKERGYSVVTPTKNEIAISEPEVIKNGGRYGVKIKTESPSYHLIKVNITTEIAPIVGSEAQAADLKNYIDKNSNEGNVWETNVFGKTVEQLVIDGISSKLTMMNDDCKNKLSDTMQKVVNENSGGLVCLII